MAEQFLADTVDSTDKAKRFHFSSLDTDALTTEEVNKIKNISWNCVGD